MGYKKVHLKHQLDIIFSMRLSNYLLCILWKQSSFHKCVYHVSTCFCLWPPPACKKMTQMNTTRKTQESADDMLLSLCCISTDGLNQSIGQSVDRCWSVEDLAMLSETPYANSGCVTWLRDTCSHSMKLGHVSVEPHATWLRLNHNVNVDWLLEQPPCEGRDLEWLHNTGAKFSGC